MRSLPVLVLLALALSPSGEWKPFSPKDGSFTVLFPGTPVERKTTAKAPTGDVEVWLYEAPAPGGGKFVAGYSEFPETSIVKGADDKRLDNARDGAVAAVKGKLKHEKSLLLDPYPGRELTIEVEGGPALVVRLYAVKNRLYQLAVVGGPGGTPKDAARFLDSFRLGK